MESLAAAVLCSSNDHNPPSKHSRRRNDSTRRRTGDDVRDQDAVPIAFQGEAGAYSEIALHKFFDALVGSLRVLPCVEFVDVFDNVLNAHARFAVLPIENALTGSIHENYDLLLQYPDICICGETRIRIQHSLVGTPDSTLEDIEIVYSHPQGLAQSSRFLSDLADMELRPFYDTAGAVAHIAKLGDKRNAAIAGRAAAGVYGMKVLVEGIETNPVNYTRFVVIKHADDPGEFYSKRQKASIVFSVADKPGALLKCMEVLSSRSLNLEKIESRPIHGKPWEYMFYLDVDIEGREEAFKESAEGLRQYSEDIRILGVYARG